MDKAPTRVLISISRKSECWDRAWGASEEVISDALGLLQKTFSDLHVHRDSSYLFIAKERWDMRIFIIFDFQHVSYDPDSAHLPDQNDLPVIIVYLQQEKASFAGAPLKNRVNMQIQKLHNSTGLGSRPPFAVDHADGKVPCYPNVRDGSFIVT
ncbi:hypothetical protein GQ44DRAFT_493386 [Phaeosphaeriaceae sp. PMI808]|nr:hypothetical protein GQ44DRAFT_493386 [Phaeosphaeriaceae sp. PMI808]